MTRFLCVISDAGYAGHKAQEILDSVLMSAAFEQDVTLLLLDSAIFQLKTQQTKVKNIANIYRSLALYDVESIYIEQESLHEKGLLISDLVIPVKTIARQQLPHFFHQFDVILG